MTRGNALRLGAASALCLLPTGLLVELPLLALIFVFGVSWETVFGLSGDLSGLWYAVPTSLAYAVVIIVAVTLLSLTYRFFVLGHMGGASRPA